MGENTDMNGTRAVDEGSELDPRTAATLLEQTKRRAQHQFEFPSPLLTLIQAGAVLAAYGAIWLFGAGAESLQRTELRCPGRAVRICGRGGDCGHLGRPARERRGDPALSAAAVES